MSMSKKDYQTIADSFARQFAALDSKSDFYPVQYGILAQMRDEIMEALARENPRFNKASFMQRAHMNPAPLFCGHLEWKNGKCGQINCNNYFFKWEERRA